MTLFSSYSLGRIKLRNRIVMAPMTRSRALGNRANALMAQYYEQRAGAGLIITEGIAPSANGLGYARIPGLYSAEQVESFRPVTKAVHARGGSIFAQLMHVGRVGHPLNLPKGARLLAPSALQAAGQMFTDEQGMQPFPQPEAMSLADIAQAQREFVQAARNAIDAGFDGVELHAANGYLLEQFLHPHSNRRTDEYGGSDAARNRFVIETARAVAEAIGSDRVGIRLSPYNTFNDLAARDDARAAYAQLAQALRGNVVYIHLMGNPHALFAETAQAIREGFAGTVMLNGGYDRARAEADIARGEGQLVSFGRPFISNPDLVHRLEVEAKLAEPDPQTFYAPGAEGYVDYPTLS